VLSKGEPPEEGRIMIGHRKKQDLYESIIEIFSNAERPLGIKDVADELGIDYLTMRGYFQVLLANNVIEVAFKSGGRYFYQLKSRRFVLPKPIIEDKGDKIIIKIRDQRSCSIKKDIAISFFKNDNDKIKSAFSKIGVEITDNDINYMRKVVEKMPLEVRV
jgi:predicted ArsR family transcriptional regulator